jgi:hypothetical protein
MNSKKGKTSRTAFLRVGLLLTWPLVTVSALQCRHLCARALEPSHRLLMTCSVTSMLPTALLLRQELDVEASRSLSHWLG